MVLQKNVFEQQTDSIFSLAGSRDYLQTRQELGKLCGGDQNKVDEIIKQKRMALILSMKQSLDSFRSETAKANGVGQGEVISFVGNLNLYLRLNGAVNVNPNYEDPLGRDLKHSYECEKGFYELGKSGGLDLHGAYLKIEGQGSQKKITSVGFMLPQGVKINGVDPTAQKYWSDAIGAEYGVGGVNKILNPQLLAGQLPGTSQLQCPKGAVKPQVRAATPVTQAPKPAQAQASVSAAEAQKRALFDQLERTAAVRMVASFSSKKKEEATGIQYDTHKGITGSSLLLIRGFANPKMDEKCNVFTKAGNPVDLRTSMGLLRIYTYQSGRKDISSDPFLLVSSGSYPIDEVVFMAPLDKTEYSTKTVEKEVPVFLGFGKRKVPEEVTVSKKVEVRSNEILANGNNERLFQLTYACPSRESVGTRKSTDTYDLLLPESQAKLLWDAMFPKQGPAPGPNLLIEFLKTRIFTAQKGLLPVEQDTFRMRPEGRESNVLLLRRNTIDYSEKIEAREVKYTPDLKQDNRKKV